MLREETVISQINYVEKGGERRPVLSFVGGPARGQLTTLSVGEHIVGRGQKATIFVMDEAISRQHFKIIVGLDAVMIEDLGSTNGTYVNGAKITKQPLKDKDTIQISSQTIITFSYFTDLEAERQAEVYRMANFDSLTQARTKQYFLDQTEKEFSYAKRRNSSLALLIFDIDFFKKINDTYGHLAGDYVLKKISEITHRVVRQEDIFARYGGEEFVVLMRETSEPEATHMAERLRQVIALHPFEFENNKMKVTISGGVSSYQSSYETPEEMLKVADRYLYVAKENGRNRIVSTETSKID